MSNPPSILVTDAHRGSSIAIIRSLGRKGWRVIPADSVPDSPGFYSRYAFESLVYPPPATDPGKFVDVLLEAARDWNLDLIIPVTDEVILPLSAERARFDGVSELALPQTEGLVLVTNKYETLKLAQNLAIPCPKTLLVHSAEQAINRADELGWPVVLKPQSSRVYRHGHGVEDFSVSYAEDISELAGRMKYLEGRCPVMLQEYYPGTGVGVELLMHGGKPLAGFQHRRLREYPLSGGPSAFRESVDIDGRLWDYAISMLRELDWTGLAMVEFKIGSHGPKLMEINGRVWGSLPLAVLSGMDFPAKLVDMYLTGVPETSRGPDFSYTRGVRARNAELDILWIAFVLSGRNKYPFLDLPKWGEGMKALLDLFNPAYKFDVLNLDDPLPGLVSIPKIMVHLSEKLGKAFVKTLNREKKLVYSIALSNCLSEFYFLQ